MKYKIGMFHEYQGGFSDDLYKSFEFQEYINSPVVAGYVGSSERTIKRDQIIEKALRKTGLGSSGVAVWLTSGDARHMMDSVDEDTSDRRFFSIAKNNAKHAFQKVTIWSHPDHRGNLASTIELRKKIAKAFSEEE